MFCTKVYRGWFIHYSLHYKTGEEQIKIQNPKTYEITQVKSERAAKVRIGRLATK